MALIPEKFLGSFKLERSENFDELIAAKGVNFLLRQVMKRASVVKTISKVSDDGPQYHMQTAATMKTMEWGPFKLGEPLHTEGFDGKQKITYSVDTDGNLLEAHLRETDTEEDVHKYTVEGDYLILNMSYKDIHAKRFMKRQ